MDKKKIPLNAYLTVICILLAALYSFSFFVKPTVDKRKSVKTALLNPKYKNEISQIQIHDSSSQLFLQKNKDVWEIVDFENPFVKLPADSKRINKMIDDFSQVIGAVQVSVKVDKSDSLTAQNFGFDDRAVEIDFFAGGESAGEIVFGKNDFTQTKRYIKTHSSNLAYEIEDFASIYLTTSIQSWSESGLISQQVLGNIKADDIQRIIADGRTFTNSDSLYKEYVSKLLELRHGGINLNEQFNTENSVYKIKLELGNKNNIDIFVYKASREGNYLVQLNYLNFKTNELSVYYESISEWTFSRLKYQKN